MKNIFSKFSAAMAPAPDVVPAQAHVIMTREGLMVSHAWPDGRFNSFAVRVPGADGEPGQWAMGRPINLAVEELEDGQANLDMIVAGEGERNEPIRVFGGRREDVEQTAISIQRAWIAMNAPAAGVNEPAMGGASAPQWGGGARVSAYANGSAAVGSAPYHRGASLSFRWRFKPWLLVTLLAIGVVIASWAAANYYLKPRGPGIDLSSMSVDDVAMLDSNPAAVRQVQESLIEAVGVGRAKAGETQAKIEQEHIEALKAMGLEPGVSMKNAMSCLAK